MVARCAGPKYEVALCSYGRMVVSYFLLISKKTNSFYRERKTMAEKERKSYGEKQFHKEKTMTNKTIRYGEVQSANTRKSQKSAWCVHRITSTARSVQSKESVCECRSVQV